MDCCLVYKGSLSKNIKYCYIVQVSLVIHGGYVPGKLGSADTKTTVLGLNLSNHTCCLRFYPVL
jgi:hypothetical protein